MNKNKKVIAIVLLITIIVLGGLYLKQNYSNEKSLVLPTPTVAPIITPLVNDSITPAKGDSVCPEKQTIDCMPPVEGSKKLFCSPIYLEWAKKNCPTFAVAY
jgi:hypothetical protein